MGDLEMRQFYASLEFERVKNKEKQYELELEMEVSIYTLKPLTPGERLHRRSYLSHAEDMRKAQEQARKIMEGGI